MFFLNKGNYNANLTFLSLRTSFFVVLWLFINLLQAAYTEIHNDESYYWVLAKELDWGFYDHPPLVAVFVKIGASIFPGELGTRFFHVISFSIALGLVLLKILKKPYLGSLEIIVIFSIPFFSYLSFMVFPDGPLLFFFAVFLLGYQRFLNGADMGSLALCTIGFAGMLYAKYHGFLVLVFLIASNPQLLRQRKFYLSGLLVLVLFLPHVGWLISNDFITFRFHLTERATGLDWKNPINFVSQQLGAVGPLLFIGAFFRPIDQFEKFLVYTSLGVFLFFLLASLRGVAHIQWTSLAFFPMVILSILYFQRNPKPRLFFALTIPFVLLTLFFRLVLVFPVLGIQKVGANYVHGRKAWAKELADFVGDRVLVVEEDLKEPTTYSFYTGKSAIALYPKAGKKSQFEMWQSEDDIQGLPVVYAKKSDFRRSNLYARNQQQKLYYVEIDSFQSLQNIAIDYGTCESVNDSLYLTFRIINHRQTPLSLNRQINYFLISPNKEEHATDIVRSPNLIPAESAGTLIVSVGSFSSPQKFRLSVDEGRSSKSMNSPVFEIKL